ncbi:MAG: hypothetical protein K2H95_00830 [Bacteroidales bacterium]|nr:hypothetical protein [Bacteroidales bacterium]
MKKLFLIIVAIASLSACDPQEWLEHHDTDWFVKNKTDVAIRVRIKRSLHWISESTEVIMPKDSVNILPYHPNIKESPDFSIFVKYVTFVTLYDANCDSLKTWDNAYQYEQKRNLFNESSWRKYRKNTESMTEDITWVFDILPEDLTPARQ